MQLIPPNAYLYARPVKGEGGSILLSVTPEPASLRTWVPGREVRCDDETLESLRRLACGHTRCQSRTLHREEGACAISVPHIASRRPDIGWRNVSMRYVSTDELCRAKAWRGISCVSTGHGVAMAVHTAKKGIYATSVQGGAYAMLVPDDAQQCWGCAMSAMDIAERRRGRTSNLSLRESTPAYGRHPACLAAP
eukprot:3256445-Rhodomonas_salina.3